MARCMGCKKSLLKCECMQKTRGKFTAQKEKTKITGKDGKTRTVTKATGNVERGGHVWCGSCRSRMLNGMCSNVTCSTRRTHDS